MGPRSSSISWFLVLLAAVSLTACSARPGATDAPATDGHASHPPAATAGAPAFPVTLTDDAAREVTLDAEPQRVVSLAPSNTEIVCALGACDRLVGVTDFDDYPPEVADVPDVVVAAVVDVERVRAAEPDLVLAAGNEFTPTSVIEQLIRLELPVLTLYAESLDEVYGDVELVGRALGASDEAADLVEAMRQDALAVESAVAGVERPRTFYEVSYYQGTIYTAGEGSFLASLLELAGSEAITGDPQSFAIALEELIVADPELILLGDATYDPSVTPESVAARPGWESMTAVREGRVEPFPEDVVVTRPGPRIVEGLEALARAIHPESFP